VETAQEGLAELRSDLLNVKSNHEELAGKHRIVARATEDLQHVAQETRKSLKDTNTLVLPNLQMPTNGGVLASASASLRGPASPRQPLSPAATPAHRASRKST
jgi:hypothetical protein